MINMDPTEYNIGDIVRMEPPAYDKTIFGYIIGKSEHYVHPSYKSIFYQIDWFDGETSKEMSKNVVRVS